MDADRCCVRQRGKRSRKLAVVVAVQNVLVAACLVVTLYVYFDVHGRKLTSGDNVHIQFEPISDITSRSAWLNFTIRSSELMSLHTKDTIMTKCEGPYILYVEVCYKSLEEGTRGQRDNKANGILQLQVAGTETPVSYFATNSSDQVCRALHSTTYLTKKDKARLYFNTSDYLKVKKVTVGLSYLLRGCDY